MKTNLLPVEAKILALLSNVNGPGMVDQIINDTVQSPDPEKVRGLISFLKDGIRDNPNGVKKIVGEECFCVLCKN